MIIEHIAIWTRDIARLRAYYMEHFRAKSNEKYTNPKKGFESYFLSFDTGARLEIMSRADIPTNANDTVTHQHLGLIHMAISVGSREAVDAKAAELKAAGHPILSGPRVTGDGYYEFETLDPDQNRIEVTAGATIGDH